MQLAALFALLALQALPAASAADRDLGTAVCEAAGGCAAATTGSTDSDDFSVLGMAARLRRMGDLAASTESVVQPAAATDVNAATEGADAAAEEASKEVAAAEKVTEEAATTETDATATAAAGINAATGGADATATGASEDAAATASDAEETPETADKVTEGVAAGRTAAEEAAANAEAAATDVNAAGTETDGETEETGKTAAPNTVGTSAAAGTVPTTGPAPATDGLTNHDERKVLRSTTGGAGTAAAGAGAEKVGSKAKVDADTHREAAGGVGDTTSNAVDNKAVSSETVGTAATGGTSSAVAQEDKLPANFPVTREDALRYKPVAARPEFAGQRKETPGPRQQVVKVNANFAPNDSQDVGDFPANPLVYYPATDLMPANQADSAPSAFRK